METLILIGLIGGLITGISPCILPMLPVIFFAGGIQGARPGSGEGTDGSSAAAGEGSSSAAPSASLFAGAPGAVRIDGRGNVAVADRPKAGTGGDSVSLSGGKGGKGKNTAGDKPVKEMSARRKSLRPYLVISGLVVSFSFFTLLGSLILNALGLPQDLLRWVGLSLLAIIGVGMIVPRLEEIIERPFQRIAAMGARRGSARQDRGAFLLGLGLGVLYVPCAGPVLAAITVAGATGNIGADTVALTVSFAVGAAIPLLIFALAGRRVAERVGAFKRHTKGIRIFGGVTMILLAIGLAFNLPQYLQRALPDYTGSLQSQINESDTVQEALDLGGLVTDENRLLSNCTNGASELESCGPAPQLSGINNWFNTPGDEALNLSDLKQEGKVVLVDFWAYSCINCQRAIPHVNAWYDQYKDVGKGFEVIGVHTPEFAFERETRNVVAGAEQLGVTYPVAQDNAYSTWTKYRNRYWPAQYLIDSDGTVRHIRFGEGGYENTEKLVRELLEQANPGVELPAETTVDDGTPQDATTPETYFSSTKVINYSGEQDYKTGDFTVNPDQPKDTFSLGGSWTLDPQGATAAADGAAVQLAYSGTNVFTVLGGEGTVKATVKDADGKVVETKDIEVTGNPNLYPVLEGDAATTGTVELELPKDVQVFTFTFG